MMLQESEFRFTNVNDGGWCEMSLVVLTMSDILETSESCHHYFDK